MKAIVNPGSTPGTSIEEVLIHLSKKDIKNCRLGLENQQAFAINCARKKLSKGLPGAIWILNSIKEVANEI